MHCSTTNTPKMAPTIAAVNVPLSEALFSLSKGDSEERGADEVDLSLRPRAVHEGSREDGGIEMGMNFQGKRPLPLQMSEARLVTVDEGAETLNDIDV